MTELYFKRAAPHFLGGSPL